MRGDMRGLPEPKKNIPGPNDKKVILLEQHDKVGGRAWVIDNIIKKSNIENIYLEIPGDMEVGDYLVRDLKEQGQRQQELEELRKDINIKDDGVFKMTLNDYLKKRLYHNNKFDSFFAQIYKTTFDKLNTTLFGVK